MNKPAFGLWCGHIIDALNIMIVLVQTSQNAKDIHFVWNQKAITNVTRIRPLQDVCFVNNVYSYNIDLSYRRSSIYQTTCLIGAQHPRRYLNQNWKDAQTFYKYFGPPSGVGTNLGQLCQVKEQSMPYHCILGLGTGMSRRKKLCAKQ